MTEFPKVSSFEIRLHKADNTVSIVMTVNAHGHYDAELQARKMLQDDIAYAVIWQGLAEVATVHRTHST
jgi:hypothetical protein